MLRSPLSYQELSDYLYGVTTSLLEDDIPHLISTLQYHQDRIEGIAPIIESLSSEPRKRGFSKPTSWVPLPKRKKKALDELRRREDDSYAAIAALRALLSPIRRLPPELLTEIFIHCLPRKDFISPNDAGTPLHLMQVCTRWQQVCLSSPQLWTSLELERPPVHQSSEDHSIDNDVRTTLLSRYVLRSGDLPLSLSIQDGLLSVGKIQALISACIGRLQHFKVMIPVKHMSLLPTGEYSRLESFEIHTPHGLYHAAVNVLSTIMMRTPTLRKFTWKSINSPVFRPPPVECHWSTLTYLVLQATITKEHCLNIISLAVNAQHLEFNDVFGLSSTPPPPLAITLPYLQSFTISSMHNITQIFDSLTLPCLTRLYINNPFSESSIMQLFQRSRFPLQGLHLFFVFFEESHLTQCLELVQSTLVELTVQTCDRAVVFDTLLDRMTNKGAGNVLCPLLQSLAFYSCVSSSHGSFTRMVRSRIPIHLESEDSDDPSSLPRVAALKTVEVYTTEPELPLLKPLRSLGLKLLAYTEGVIAVSVDLDAVNQPQ